MKHQCFTSTLITAGCTIALTALSAVSALAGSVPAAKSPVPVTAAADWKINTIAPVTNPIFFEDAVIRSEVRPIYMHHNIDNDFITRGGDVDVYALQLRYAVTNRLAIIATKDGYIDLETGAGSGSDGWADVSAGLKYALIDNQESQFILTPGFTFEIPVGDSEVFQGNGDGKFDVFVSAQKGFNDFHIQGNTGVILPLDGDANSTVLHYSLMADYYVSRYFIPFVTLNGFTVLDEGNTLPIDTEGFDLINFGSSASNGATQIALGVGFRTRLADNLDFGIAYEKAVGSDRGLYDDRITADLTFRF